MRACGGTIALRRELGGRLTRAEVYRVVYAAAYDGVGPPPLRSTGNRLDTFFVRALLRGVEDDVTLEEGWTVDLVAADHVLLTRDGVRAVAGKSELSGRLEPGEAVAVQASAVRSGVSPGFVSRFGGLDTQLPMSRVYLAAQPEHAPILLGSLARALDEGGIEHIIKVVGHPAAYYRCDASVVYVSSSQETEAVRTITGIVDDQGILFRDVTPLLSLKVRTGMALADDPSDIEPRGGQPLSHGQWVSALLMEAVAQTADAQQMAAAVNELVGLTGRNPDHPYRRPAAE